MQRACWWQWAIHLSSPVVLTFPEHIFCAWSPYRFSNEHLEIWLQGPMLWSCFLLCLCPLKLEGPRGQSTRDTRPGFCVVFKSIANGVCPQSSISALFHVAFLMAAVSHLGLLGNKWDTKESRRKTQLTWCMNWTLDKQLWMCLNSPVFSACLIFRNGF